MLSLQETKDKGEILKTSPGNRYFIHRGKNHSNDSGVVFFFLTRCHRGQKRYNIFQRWKERVNSELCAHWRSIYSQMKEN